ncbi:hypothetical protein [Neorhizobium galegae]|uniref:hypothetical protein n=1 Tax=Neorhizobium galegae TaxID=399 RepID=UPI000621D96D|nr:hypothetical protein [Neorhizobium galegae]KAB1126314.1 hypothetical protein F4V90_04150 [Neorhizobium galegae]MCQ1805285.1 hypothetical protein [Neorhizobium galegae]CDZ56047.1 Hypothetical protein NGAL_HAMBI2566_05970 [Neorhizobium galegae bv. orientalis]
MNTSPETIPLQDVVEDLRQKVADEKSFVSLARELDVDYQRLAYFVRSRESVVRPDLLVKLLARYGYTIVKLAPESVAA